MIAKFKFKNNVKKSPIDNFINDYCTDPAGVYHTSEQFRKLSVDEQLDLFKEKLLLLLKFAYKHDLRVSSCRVKKRQMPCNFTELVIEIPKQYTNIITYSSDGEEEDEPMVEIIFTIQKINPETFIHTVDEFGESLFRCSSVTLWVSYDIDGWASIGIEPSCGERALIEYENRPHSYLTTVDPAMVLDTDICKALEGVLKDVADRIKADKNWHTWFILQGIDIEEVFLWKLSYCPVDEE